MPCVATDIVLWAFSLITFLPPANEVCEGYVFTPVCHSVHRGSVPGPGGVWSWGVPGPGGFGPRGCLVRGGLVPACLAGFQAHTQGGSWGGSGPGPHPRGKLKGIWSRPTPKGEVEGDLVQGHTQGGSWGGSGPGPHPPPPMTATAAGSTHPTGMHSCSECVFLPCEGKPFIVKVDG